MGFYCQKHACWYYAAKCPKCESGEPAYKRHRSEVADPNEWKLFKRRGWVDEG